MQVEQAVETLLRDGFVLVFNQDKLDVVRTAEALMRAGVNNMEVTCRIRRPLEKLQLLRRTFDEFVVGVASLVDWPGVVEAYNRIHGEDPLPTVEQAVEAGACYLVSAGNFRDETYQRYAGRIALIPGCGSVTELLSQFSKGANLCKIFPAKQLGGPAFVKAIDPAIHKMIPLVPTGGTNAGNIPEYIEQGVLVVGASFSMIEKATISKIVAEQNYDLLTEQFKAIKELIDRLRAEKYPQIDFARTTVSQISEATGRSFNL